jgi:hypothetical protein
MKREHSTQQIYFETPGSPNRQERVMWSMAKSGRTLKSGHFLKTAAAHLQNRRNSCADLAESADLLDQSRVRAAFIRGIRGIREPIPLRLRIVPRLQGRTWQPSVVVTVWQCVAVLLRPQQQHFSPPDSCHWRRHLPTSGGRVRCRACRAIRKPSGAFRAYCVVSKCRSTH